ncbi:MAG: hypothetical protein V1790_16405 [Planctomycetota bacterium]
MSLRLSDADAALLAAIAEHNTVTLGQLAIILGRNANSLRRRLCVATTPNGFHSGIQSGSPGSR